MNTVDWVLVLLLVSPVPLVIYTAWRDYLIDKDLKGFIEFTLLLSCPALNLFPIYTLFNYKENKEDEDDFIGYKTHLNGLRTCNNCNITSRKYQFLFENDVVKCPNCGSYDMSSVRYEKDTKYPFAPKLGEFAVIKRILHTNRVAKLKSKLSITERYDKELEAYGKLQMKKLHELEAKANEIRAELGKSGASNNENG